MGLWGSLMASTSRSCQSLMAWLMAQTRGPASSTPVSATGHCAATGTPDDATPQANAHIGGNQVTGLSSSRTADGAG
jgi:hypothetical protein